MSDLLRELKAHLMQMAPHVRERKTGQLLARAAAEIERLTGNRPDGEACHEQTDRPVR